MHPEDFRALYALEKTLWWFAGMREVTAAVLDTVCPPGQDRMVLDAGCGTGVNLAWLRRYAGSGRVLGLDIDPLAVQLSRSRQADVFQASATDLPMADAKVDLVTSFDVLQQLPEGRDEAAIREMWRVLRPDGIAFVRVAAYEWMRSSHDEALGTRHRYRLASLVHGMRRAGFRVVRATYANSLLLPVAAFRRLVLKPLRLAVAGSDVRPLPPALGWLNAPLERALRLEALLLSPRRTWLPFGLSAVCVGRKN